MTEIVQRNVLFLDFPGINNPHLHIILLNPVGNNPAKTVMVNISTFHAHVLTQDTTVLLEIDDHPYIRHTSFVDYDHAKIVDVNVIESLVDKNQAEFHDNVSDDVFDRIVNGLLTSKRTPYKVKKLYRQNI